MMTGESKTKANKWRPLAMVAGVVAFAGALWITSGYGPGLDPDSMAYVGAATSLAHGNGLKVPLGKWEQSDSTLELTTWPPAFSATMAVPQLLGLAPLSSARLILAASAAITIAVLALLFGGVLPAAGLGAALLAVAATPSFVGVHLSVLSEPLFIASLAVCLYAMVRGRPALAGAAAGLAVMTRYAGVSAALATALWFLFFERGSLRRRLARSAVSSAPAAAAFLLWMIHNSRVRVVQSAITFEYHSGLASTLREGWETLTSWIAPGAPGTVGAAIGALAAGGLMAALLSRRKRGVSPHREAEQRISLAAGLLLVTYLAVILASRLFVGGAIRFDARILAPAIILIEVILIPLVARAFSPLLSPVRLLGYLALLVWIGAAARAEAPVVLDSIADGNDFASSDWRESPTADWTANEGRSYRIYTNWPAAVYFDAHRNAYDLPNYADPDSLALFGQILRERHGVLAAFNVRSLDYPAIDSIVACAGLVRIRALSDGAIWAPVEERAAIH